MIGLVIYDGERFRPGALRDLPAAHAEFRLHNPALPTPGRSASRSLAGRLDEFPTVRTWAKRTRSKNTGKKAYNMEWLLVVGKIKSGIHQYNVQ
jgi:hypothetical protein